MFLYLKWTLDQRDWTLIGSLWTDLWLLRRLCWWNQVVAEGERGLQGFRGLVNLVVTEWKVCFHWLMFLVFQVFVNFAKDQSDDYHSKDSVRRKDVVIELPTVSSDSRAVGGGGTLRESIMWCCLGLDLQLRKRPLLTFCDVIVWGRSHLLPHASQCKRLWRCGAEWKLEWLFFFCGVIKAPPPVNPSGSGFANMRWRIWILSNYRFKLLIVFYLCISETVWSFSWVSSFTVSCSVTANQRCIDWFVVFLWRSEIPHLLLITLWNSSLNSWLITSFMIRLKEFQHFHTSVGLCTEAVYSHWWEENCYWSTQ